MYASASLTHAEYPCAFEQPISMRARSLGRARVLVRARTCAFVLARTRMGMSCARVFVHEDIRYVRACVRACERASVRAWVRTRVRHSARACPRAWTCIREYVCMRAVSASVRVWVGARACAFSCCAAFVCTCGCSAFFMYRLHSHPSCPYP
eukprot:6212987-Pleurochrysis_carterae.AAC.4